MSYTLGSVITDIGYQLEDPDLYTYADDVSTDKDGYETNDTSKNVIRSDDGNVTHDWTRG